LTKDDADDVKRYFDEKSAETQRHFDVVAERLEGQIRQVAEGVDLNAERLDRVEQTLDHMDQRFDRFEQEVGAEFAGVKTQLDRFEHEVRSEFAEVKSMIKLSFAELDRRITTLETTVQDLTTRLERLETRIS
jgi:chromosome segregation ATPase